MASETLSSPLEILPVSKPSRTPGVPLPDVGLIDGSEFNVVPVKVRLLPVSGPDSLGKNISRVPLRQGIQGRLEKGSIHHSSCKDHCGCSAGTSQKAVCLALDGDLAVLQHRYINLRPFYCSLYICT